MTLTPAKETRGRDALVALILAIPIIIFRGWVLSILWGWFIMPLGVRPIGVALATGVALVLSDLRGQKKFDDDETWAVSFAKALFLSLMNLGFGWVVHLFVR